MTALRNREVQLVAHKKIGITAIGHAIELTRQLRRTTDFAACDVVIAGYQQTLAPLNRDNRMYRTIRCQVTI